MVLMQNPSPPSCKCLYSASNFIPFSIYIYMDIYIHTYLRLGTERSNEPHSDGHCYLKHCSNFISLYLAPSKHPRQRFPSITFRQQTVASQANTQTSFITGSHKALSLFTTLLSVSQPVSGRAASGTGTGRSPRITGSRGSPPGSEPSSGLWVPAERRVPVPRASWGRRGWEQRALRTPSPGGTGCPLGSALGGQEEPTRPRPTGTSAEDAAGPVLPWQHWAAGQEKKRAMPPTAGPSAVRMTAPLCCTAAAPSSRASPPRSPSPPRRRETRPAAPHGSARHGTPPPPRVPAARLPRQPRRGLLADAPRTCEGGARRGGSGASPARRSARRPPRPRAPRPDGKVSLPRPSAEEPPGTRTVPPKSPKAAVGAGSRVAAMRESRRPLSLPPFCPRRPLARRERPYCSPAAGEGRSGAGQAPRTSAEPRRRGGSGQTKPSGGAGGRRERAPARPPPAPLTSRARAAPAASSRRAKWGSIAAAERGGGGGRRAAGRRDALGYGSKSAGPRRCRGERLSCSGTTERRGGAGQLMARPAPERAVRRGPARPSRPAETPSGRARAEQHRPAAARSGAVR